jgi:transmembrane sensor
VKKHYFKDYQNFSVNDFVLDQFFYDWVIKQDDAAILFWEQWCTKHPEKKRQINEAIGILKKLSFSEHLLTNQDVADLWHRIKTYESPNIAPKPKSTINHAWIKIAALLLICIAIVYGIFQFKGEDFISYNTAFGETKVIVLPDSSTVTLNSNSTLKFPHDWDLRAAREVWLEGEGFFSVVHKTDNQTFKVYTDDGLAVEVLGTTFNVYHRIEETKVVLNTGKIRISVANDSKKIIMNPGDLVEYKRKTYSKRTVNPTNYSAWTEKKLVLDHTSLREMVQLLKDNYGLDVSVKSEVLLNQTVSGSMPLAEAGNMVQQIALVFELKVENVENKYLLYE